MNEIKFNIAEINLCTELEGPHKRMAIWFQGCNLNCKGCCNPELQSFEKKHILSLPDLLEIAKESKINNSIEGITFLGGEPTLQKHLDILAREYRKHDLGVILFTGSELNQFSKEYITNFDLIIDGKFEIEKLDRERNLIGSENQKIHLISKRYKNELTWFYEKRSKASDINVCETIYVTGDPLLTKK